MLLTWCNAALKRCIPLRAVNRFVRSSIITWEMPKSFATRRRDAGLEAFGGVNAPYIWVKTPDGLTSWQLFDRMLRELNVVITPGAGFGAQGEGYFRISAFNSRENAEEVARRLKTLRSS